MSVILKALKSNDGKKDEPSSSLDLTSGFFQEAGKPAPKKEEEKKPTIGTVIDEIPERPRLKRIHILAGALVIALSFVFVYHKISHKKGTKVIQNTVEIVNPADVVPADPAEMAAKQARDAYASGDLDASMNLFKKAVDQNPKSAQLHNNFGLVLAKKGLYAEAASEYDKALEIDENCAECLNNYGMLKSLTGDSSEAKRFLEEAIEVNPKYADPYFNLGVLSEKSGVVKDAVGYYKSFVELYPNKQDSIVTKVGDRIKILGGGS